MRLRPLAGSNPTGCTDVSLARVVCCQVEVSATGQSLALRSPTECTMLECDLETSTTRRSRSTNSTVHVIPSSINQEPKMEPRNCVAVVLLHTICNKFTAMFSYLNQKVSIFSYRHTVCYATLVWSLEPRLRWPQKYMRLNLKTCWQL